MPKKRNSRKKSIQNIQSIGCPHLHTHTLPQLGISTCFSCLMIYYNGCEYRKIEDSKEAIQSIKILKTHLDDIRVTADVNRLHIQFKNNFDELSVFSSELDSLNKRLEVAIQQNNCQDFLKVKEAALKLMQKLDSSEMMAVYAKHCVHSLLDRRVNGISKTELKSCSNKLKSNENIKHLENEECDSTHEETKDHYKDDYFMLIESYGTKYRDLEAKVKTLDKTKKELESKVNSFEEYKKEAEEKCKKLDAEIADSKKLNDENTKKIEELKEEVKNYIVEIDERNSAWINKRTSIAELYKTKVGSALAANDADIELSLSLNNQTHLDVLNSLLFVKLPNIKRILLYNYSDKSKELLQFLTYSLPDQLPLFYSYQSLLQDADFYIKGLERLATVATKEIYLCSYSFSNNSFERFIKCCKNVKRLVFTCCKFDFDSELDFSGPELGVEFIGFYCCQCHGNSWNTKPERFERLVKAIAGSGLKDSVKTIDVTTSSLITVDQVKPFLRDYKIEHINVLNSGSISALTS